MSQSTVKKIPNNYFDGMPVTGFHKIVFFIIMMAYYRGSDQFCTRGISASTGNPFARRVVRVIYG